MNIQGRSIILRAIERDDLPYFQQWGNDPEIQANLGSWQFPLSKASLEQWFDSFRHDGVDQRFVVDSTDHGVIGTTNLVSINWKDRNAFSGMLLGDAAVRGKGYGVDTVTTLMRYAFEELGLERLDGSIIEYNEASFKLYVGRCGWVEEGRKARAFYRKNQYWSNVIVGVTRDQYETWKNGKSDGNTSER
jgi:RimJ/RimL family protein N-acetyltransferase